MKPVFASLCVGLALAVGLSGLSFDAEAKRLGGGKAAGMQRQAPASPAPAAPTQNTAAPATQPGAPAQVAPRPAGATPTPAAAAPQKRSWMGPLAGLAAGLGLAALFSHFGMGDALASAVGSILIVALLAAAAFWLIRRFMNRGTPSSSTGAGPQPAWAGASGGGTAFEAQTHSPTPAQHFEPATAKVASGSLFDGFQPTPAGTAPSAAPPASPVNLSAQEREDLARLARMLFVRLQAANDSGDLDDLRRFTTPELFSSLRLDLQDRGASTQQTDVVQVNAQVVDIAEERGEQVVSVRFEGLIRESAGAPAEPFREVWHLVRTPSAPEWRIAGLTPES